jgi:hypothetical protein
MREALKKIYSLAQAICDYKEEPAMVYLRADLIERAVNAALAKPSRNCDVGTAEEHLGKFESFCKTMSCNCCPCNLILKNGECRCNCFAWDQMPYEKEGGAK